MLVFCFGRYKPALRSSLGSVLLAALSTVCLFAQDYGGPSVLSRGGAAAGTRGGAPINFVYYGGISGIYTNSSLPLNEGTGLQKASFFGGSLELGLTGSHLWRRSMMGIDYRGSLRYDSYQGVSNGSEHALSMYFTTRPTRATQVMISETATTSSFAFGGYTAAAAATSEFVGVPLNDLFDSRVYSTQTSGAFAYRQSRFLTYQLFGGFFSIYRSNRSLVGVNGSEAGASIRYMPSRRISVNTSYNYTYFSFPRAYGNSAAHSVQIGLSYKPSRAWTFTGSAGGYRVESLGVQSVTLIPEIAELLGISTSIRSIYRINYGTNFSLNAIYGFKRSNFHIGYNKGLTPGNGIYLTSSLQSADVGYSYSGIRKLSLSINGSYERYDSLFQDLSTYDSYQAGVSANYVVRPHVNLMTTVDVRKFSITAGRTQIGTMASFGVLLSPSRLPLPAW